MVDTIQHIQHERLSLTHSLERKARKVLIWSLLLALPSIGISLCIGLIMHLRLEKAIRVNYKALSEIVIDRPQQSFRRALLPHQSGRSRVGLYGEIKVEEKLYNILPQDAIIMNDVQLPGHKGPTQIDHLVIGTSGVMVIETKHHSGVVQIDPYEDKWVEIIKGVHGQTIKRSIYNPLRQNYGHIQAVKEILNPLNVGQRVFGLVIFSVDNADLEWHNLAPDDARVEPIEWVDADTFSAVLRRKPSQYGLNYRDRAFNAIYNALVNPTR